MTCTCDRPRWKQKVDGRGNRWFTEGMTNTASATKTPGYNCRLAIFFDTDKNGRKVAYRWSGRQVRAFRMSVADAELFIAQDQADRLAGHPLKEAK